MSLAADPSSHAPFNFPPPLRLVNENCTEGDGAYGDKCLGLWRLADLPA